jgi:flavin-dependent dehydrogenase
VDAVVIGGGPAGAASGRLLAAWGHSVAILDHPSPRARGLAESIPPSTHKLLAEIGLLDAVERAGFLRGRGNTVWWASAEPRFETFRPQATSAPAGDLRPRQGPPSPLGYQVFRPDFDRVLLDSAASAGARVQTNARVRHVAFAEQHATVDYDHEGQASRIEARLVLDCSGRTGVVARRFRRVQPGQRTYALVGVWERDRWDLPDDTHTVVETFEDGWAWSVPISATVRHIGVMVGPPPLTDAPPGFRLRANAESASAGQVRPRAIGASAGQVGVAGPEQRYADAIEKTAALRQRLAGATLRHDWACDASLYYSEAYAGSQFFLVGDAGSFIDPLSSFGVKKALASAWLAAVAAHTSLLDSGRQTVAREFFSNWERGVYATHLRRSRDFARAALAEHPSAFWAARADVEILAPSDDEDAIPADSVRFGTTSPLALRYADEVRFEDRPVIRGREIVLEKAFAGGIRFAHHVDLVTLAEIACQSNRLPELFEKYCQRCAPVPLPNIVGGLSLLVARGILHDVA